MKNRIILFSILVLVLFGSLHITLADNPDSGLNIGDAVSHFNANDQNGELWNSKNHIGKKNLVIYFYPAALTGGCTKQACSYRDDKSLLISVNTDVIGVSADPVKNLKIFENMHNLNFTLLSDVNGEIAKIFGVAINDGGSITREVDGKDISLSRSFSESRWTFIIDKSGKVIYKDTEVNAASDSEKVMEFINKLEKK